jgi:hypothetical protein
VCVCVCVCVCARACVCVCVCVFLGVWMGVEGRDGIEVGVWEQQSFLSHVNYFNNSNEQD